MGQFSSKTDNSTNTHFGWCIFDFNLEAMLEKKVWPCGVMGVFLSWKKRGTLDINCVFLGFYWRVMDNIAWQPIGGHDLEKCSALSIFAAKKNLSKVYFMIRKGQYSVKQLTTLSERINHKSRNSESFSTFLQSVVNYEVRLDVG